MPELIYGKNSCNDGVYLDATGGARDRKGSEMVVVREKTDTNAATKPDTTGER